MTAPNRLYSAALLAATALALSACASDKSGYPSLARRDIERIANQGAPEAPAATPTEVPASPELAARLDALVARARAAHGRFLDHRARAEQLGAAAEGAEVASESWSVASIALAELESARSDAMIALADLDQLYTAARINGGAASAIASARDQVIALVSEEDTVLTRLRGRVAG